MHISIKSNVKEITRGLNRLQKKQIPFATMLALNDAASEISMKYLRKEADRKFDGGATAFTKRGFKYTKASKTNLTASVYIDDIQSEYLQYQIDGGTRRPKSKVIAAPGYNTRLNRYGNVSNANRKKYWSKSDKYKTDRSGIYERQGRGKASKWIKVLNFIKFAVYRPKFPYYRLVRDYMGDRAVGFRPKFERRLSQALKTSKK